MADASSAPSGPRLPPVQQALLDPATLAQLFADLAACTQILAVLPKAAAQQHVAVASVPLDDARQGLAAGRYRGVQVRYRYDGQEWCDTLLATPAGVRLVRISQDDVQRSAGA